ncbi:MAG: hypothetical protein ACKVT1_00690 [Dehalococcoidia bacterium]
MNARLRPLTEVTDEAVGVLVRELGVTDTLRFLSQFGYGGGDYTVERRAWVERSSVSALLDAYGSG